MSQSIAQKKSLKYILIMVAFIVIFVIAIASILLFLNNKADIPEIDKVNSIKDIVMSVNHGRIYPFYTRMNFIRAKEAAMKITLDSEELEQTIQMQEIIGIKPYFNLPISNNYIERVSVSFNEAGLVSSIGIDIKNFNVNMTPLIQEMARKFGRPISIDNEFIIWREGPMVVNICMNGSLSVIDETLFNA